MSWPATNPPAVPVFDARHTAAYTVPGWTLHNVEISVDPHALEALQSVTGPIDKVPFAHPYALQCRCLRCLWLRPRHYRRQPTLAEADITDPPPSRGD